MCVICVNQEWCFLVGLVYDWKQPVKELVHFEPYNVIIYHVFSSGVYVFPFGTSSLWCKGMVSSGAICKQTISLW